MAIKVKVGGAYVTPNAIFVKNNGAYSAVQSIFAKVAGVYQSILSVSNTLGPYTLGSPAVVGASGRSYFVTTGDDFTNGVTYVAPGNPAGRYSTTRAYMGQNNGNGPRANTGSLSLKGYDADALHTGHNDANRGVAISSFSDLITTTGGRLQLKSRTATSAEKATFNGTPPNASAMLHTATSHVVMAPFFVECKMKLTKSQADMHGWHPTFWMMQMKSVTSYTGTELDWEATSVEIQSNKYGWNAGVSTPNTGPNFTYVNGTEYTYRIEVLVDGSVNFYSNTAAGGGSGAMAFVRTLAAGATADTSRPFYVLLTNHTADFDNDPYQDSQWISAGAGGAVMDIDYFAMMTSVGTLYQPLLSLQTYNVDYGAAVNIALPSANALWGSAVTEDIESWAQESNEPGGDYEGGYRNVAPGLTYDLSALTVTGTPILTSTKTVPANNSGRIMICRYTKVPGTACVPHRTVINVGPHWLSSTIPPASVGVSYSYDLYAKADCGVLVSNSSGARSKSISVSGLPSGLSYSNTTGLITGTPASAFNATLTATVTNSVGQTSAVTLQFAAYDANQGVPAPTLTGAPTVRNSWDFDNLSTLTLDSSTPPHINSVAPAGAGTLTLANASATTSPTRILRPNNRNAALFNKALAQYLQGSATQTSGGTLVVVYEPVTTAASQVFERSRAASSNTTNREGVILNGYVAARRANGTGVADAQTAPALNTAALHVAVAVFDPASTNISLYFDGASTTVTGTIGQPANPMDTVTMGGRYGVNAFSLPFDGYIYRVLDYPVVLTAEQAEQVAVWAATNYGTPNGA